MRKDFAIDRPVEADVKLGLGRVDTQRAEPGTAWAQVEAVDPSHEASVRLAAQATITLDGHRLRVHLPESGRLFRRAEIAVALGLPAASSLAVKGGAVDVTVLGGVDAAAVKLGAGDITIDEATTALDVKAGQTDVRVGTVGDVNVTTGQGSVRLGSTDGAVAVKGGSVDLDIAEARAGTVVFTTGSGSASVAVAAGTTVEMDLVSASGDVRCELPMESSAPPAGAGLRLRARTGSGDLRVGSTSDRTSAAAT